MDISTTRHLGHRGSVRGSGENDSINLFASYFLWKEKNPLTHCRSSKYDVDQDGRTGTHEYSDVSEVEVPKLLEGKCGTYSGCDRGRSILQRRPPTDARGRNSVTGRKTGKLQNETKLEGLVCDLKGTNICLILRAKNTGAWLSVRGTTVSGTVLSATEFWDFLCKSYNVSPLNLQSHCGICGTVFSVMHAPSYSTVGLVIVRHNKICDKILYIS